jgi:hypothetical protein
VSAVQSRIVVLAIDYVGTVELAVVNIAGGNDLTETGLITTTAEGGGGAADSNNVIYSTTARSNVAYRVVGYIESTQATAGTWATTPSTIQGQGGQALNAMSSLGYGQTWVNNSAGITRALSTTYYSGAKPIAVVVYTTNGSGSQSLTATIGGVAVIFGSNNALPVGSPIYGNFIVPPFTSYAVTVTGSPTLQGWAELR